MNNKQELLLKFLPVLIIVWCVSMIGALYFGWFDCLTFSTCRQDLRGIDFFAVPKSFINLMEGRSAFDTWGGEQWGPYATWYLAHPAYSVFVASWFSFFEPWTSYWVFAFFSLGLFAACAYLISNDAESRINKLLPWFFLLCSTLTFAVLYTGNMHAPVVLSITLILSGLFGLTYKGIGQERRSNNLLMIGLLISFFSKPVVILFMPLLLINRITRRQAFISLMIYGIVSLLFLIIPVLNPEAIGIPKTIELFLDPAFVKENMNIYKNNFKLNEFMKDNSIHWLNLIAQSDFYWNHVDIFSLSSFLNTLAGKQLPGFIYKLPYWICAGLSLFAFRIKDRAKLMEYTLLIVSAICFTFFLGYNSVWEYQYALVLPLLAYVPIIYSRGLISRSQMWTLLISGIFFLIPNFYWIFPKENDPDNFMMNCIRAGRVLPAVIFYCCYVYTAIGHIKQTTTS